MWQSLSLASHSPLIALCCHKVGRTTPIRSSQNSFYFIFSQLNPPICKSIQYSTLIYLIIRNQTKKLNSLLVMGVSSLVFLFLFVGSQFRPTVNVGILSQCISFIRDWQFLLSVILDMQTNISHWVDNKTGESNGPTCSEKTNHKNGVTLKTCQREGWGYHHVEILTRNPSNHHHPSPCFVSWSGWVR